MEWNVNGTRGPLNLLSLMIICLCSWIRFVAAAYGVSNGPLESNQRVEGSLAMSLSPSQRSKISDEMIPLRLFLRKVCFLGAD